MRVVVLGVALALSLWPAAVLAYGVDRVLGGGDDPASPSATTARALTTATQAKVSAAAPAAARSTAEGPLAELNRLRDETADLVVALNDSPAVSGLPDSELSGRALDVEAELIAWQEQYAGTNADAEYYARLFTEIASACADYATAPSPGSRARLETAIRRHRRETLQGGA